MYIIKIKNCNSIDNAEINILENTLNIKYGPNGIGKSTIAKAIIASTENNELFKSLKPFKCRQVDDQHDPVVLGAETIGSVLVFDDIYISQFAFQRDEVLKNSFDIFINTETYKTAMQEIENLFAGVKSTFEDNEALMSAITDLKEVRDAFGVTKLGALSKSSKGYKAFGSGNKIENIPPQLMPFKAFIKSEQPANWIAWQAKGNTFLDLSDNCPYCASDLREPTKKEMAKLVAKEYDSKSIEHLNALQMVINRLGKYFEESCRESLEKITKSKIELSLEETNFLSSLRGDVETLIAKLEGLRSISFFSLRDVDKIEDEITKLTIDLFLLPKLKSEDTQNIVIPINERLKELIEKVGFLKGKINIHKRQIEDSIIKNQNSINGFLKSAGYKYSVVIKSEADTYKMKLVHQDFNEHIESSTQHLSYGEKNAFALVLFMHQVLSEKPGLAILDDPVSSFDKTKKFAILNKLFCGKESLRNNTVLMLTHDLEPVIDIVRVKNGIFNAPKPTTFFLVAKEGDVTEIEITESDIQTFTQICQENINSISDIIIKCIYLRRYYEILNNYNAEYNCLANLLHARKIPIFKTRDGKISMPEEEFLSAIENIKKHVPEFDYNSILSIINDKTDMKRRFHHTCIGYDKLQLFRTYIKAHSMNTQGDDIFQKFINESFHIENEYLMQLNPHRFDNVPEYVVCECDRLMSLS